MGAGDVLGDVIGVEEAAVLTVVADFGVGAALVFRVVTGSVVHIIEMTWPSESSVHSQPRLCG